MVRCEELNNSPQIPIAVTTDGFPLTRYAANLRSNGAVKSGWRKHLERELRDQGAEIERVETTWYIYKNWHMA